MTIAEFKRELARLIKEGSTAGLSNDDMADELIVAIEYLPINVGIESRPEKDPVGDIDRVA